MVDAMLSQRTMGAETALHALDALATAALCPLVMCLEGGGGGGGDVGRGRAAGDLTSTIPLPSILPLIFFGMIRTHGVAVRSARTAVPHSPPRAPLYASRMYCTGEILVEESE